MSNFKKVILFVSMIAVLVSSLMLPTFADDADYPLTDPYIEGYNGDLYVFNIDNVNLTSFTKVSSSSTESYIRPQQGVYFAAVILVTKTDGTVIEYDFIPTSNTDNSAYFRWGGIVPITDLRIQGVSIGIQGVRINNRSIQTSLYVNYNTGRVTLIENVNGDSVSHELCTISEFDNAQVRIYLNYNDIKNNSGNSYSTSFVYETMGFNIDYLSYRNAQSYYNNGITAGIQQGYQNGFDEGYQEGYASAGGSFADIVSNPEPGYGVPDVHIDIQPKPQDYIYPSDTEYFREYLARFKVATGSIERVSDGVEMLPGLYSMECQWLGNDPGDPPTGKGYVFYFYNDDESIHGTLWYTIDAIGDGDTIAANAWYWFPDYKMNGMVSVAPYRVNPKHVQAWVHGDSTALLESKPLTDDGFYITYPYMGEEFYTNGYDRGYGNGLKDGFDGADTSQAWMNLKDTIFVIFDAPFYVISQSLNFDLFGINIAGAIISIISVALIVFILKIIIVRLF